MKGSINDRIVQLIEGLEVSQNNFARALEVSSSRISNVTTGRNKPDSEFLEKILMVFRNVSAEWLLTGRGVMFLEKGKKGDLKVEPKGDDSVQHAQESYTKKINQPIVESHVVDTSGLKLIPIVDIKAAAGTGYINEHTLTQEDVIRLPAHLVKSGNHLCIRVKGPSMAPTFQDGGYLIIRLLDRSEWSTMHNERVYVVVDTEGKTFVKRIKNRFSGENGGFIVLMSDSPDKQAYPNFNLHPHEIQNIWYVEWYFTAKMPNIHDTYFSRVSNLEDQVQLLTEEFRNFQKRLK